MYAKGTSTDILNAHRRIRQLTDHRIANIFQVAIQLEKTIKLSDYNDCNIIVIIPDNVEHSYDSVLFDRIVLAIHFVCE